MKNQNIAINSIADLINYITSDSAKRDLAIAIIKQKPEIINKITNSTELSTFIKVLGFTDDRYKSDLAIKIIEKKPEILGDNKEEGLSELIKAFGNDFYYRVDLICDLLKELPQTIVIDFKTLNDNLYPDDYLKKELILEAIKEGVIHKDNFLKCGFDEIKTDDIYLSIFRF